MDCFVDSLHARGMPAAPPDYEVHSNVTQSDELAPSDQKHEEYQVALMLD